MLSELKLIDSATGMHLLIFSNIESFVVAELGIFKPTPFAHQPV